MRLFDRVPDLDETPPPDLPDVLPAVKGRRNLGRKSVIAAAVVLAAALLGLALAGAAASSSTPVPAPGMVPAMSVTLAPAMRAAWDSTLEASGTIEPWQETVIGAQIAGLRLLEVRADVGDTVKRGQLLARFDGALLRAGQAELEALLRQAQAHEQQAAANRQRARTLKDSGGISQQEVLQYETEAETSAAQVAVAKAQLDSRRLQLGYTDVIAPDDGVISARATAVGAVAGSGQELFRLIRQGRLEWRGELTATQLAQVERGQRIVLRLPDGSQATARLRQSAPRLDQQSRLATVYADIDPGSRARAGMYAAGKIVLAQRPATVVPAGAVVIRDGRSYIFKLDHKTTQPVVTAQAVRTGRRQGALVEIIGELAEGERVVAQGAGFLKDGDAVRVIGARGAP